MKLDLIALLLVVVASYHAFGLLQWRVWLRQPQESAVAFWAASNLACAGGSLMLGLQTVLLPALMIGIGNALLAMGYILMWFGLRRFAKQRVDWLWLALLPLMMALLFSAVPWFSDHSAHRVQVSSLLIAGFSLACFFQGRSAQRAEHLDMRRVAMGAQLAMCGALALRVHGVWQGELQGANFVGGGSKLALATLLMLIIGLIWNISVLLMVGERLANRLANAADFDALTGVLNRSGLRHRADRYLSAARQEQARCFVILIDMDRFKSVNDTHGHSTGDRLLQRFAEALRFAVRQGDLVARHGGEEFVCLFFSSSPAAVLEAAERIREACASTFVDTGGQRIGRTASIGVSDVQADEKNIDAALDRADEAMYRAKQAGGNRVEAALSPVSVDLRTATAP